MPGFVLDAQGTKGKKLRQKPCLWNFYRMAPKFFDMPSTEGEGQFVFPLLDLGSVTVDK